MYLSLLYVLWNYYLEKHEQVLHYINLSITWQRATASPANRLIPVQFAKMQNGFNSNSVVTRTTLDGMENGIKENEKGVFYRCTAFRKWKVVLTNPLLTEVQ